MSEDWLYRLAAALAGMWLVLLQWVAVRTIRRLDRIEEHHVTKADVSELKIAIHEISKDISVTNQRLAHIEGALDREERRR